MLESSQTKGLPCLQREIFHEEGPHIHKPSRSPFTMDANNQVTIRIATYTILLLYCKVSCNVHGNPLVREVTCL